MKYEPRPSKIELENECGCGHKWFYHDTTIISILGPKTHAGKCCICMCPKLNLLKSKGVDIS